MALTLNGNEIAGAPSFPSKEEAYEWAGSGDGVAVLSDLFKKGFSNGVTEFKLDYS